MKPKNRQGNNQTPQKKSNQVLSDSANNSTKEKIGQTNSNTTASNEESNDNENKHENFKKVIDNETEITIGQKANKISAISAFINALLFISTIVVLAYSIRATNASIKSAEVADSTLKVTKNLFEVQNEPYLQVDNFKIDTFTKKDGIKYKLVIKNLGNYPVKIVDCIFINTIRKSPPSFDSIPCYFDFYKKVFKLPRQYKIQFYYVNSLINADQYQKTRKDLVQRLAVQPIAPSNAFIQIEVETLGQLREALDAGAVMVLLDNMSIDQMTEAVSINEGRAELEASGGVDFDRVRSIAETGVDRISIGVLTKNVRAIDLSLRHVER